MKQDNFFYHNQSKSAPGLIVRPSVARHPVKKNWRPIFWRFEKKSLKCCRKLFWHFIAVAHEMVWRLLWRLLWRYCDAAATLLRRCSDVTATKREAKRAACTFFQAHRRRSHEIEDRTRGEKEWERERERKGVLTRSAQAGFMSGAGLIYL